MFAILMVLKIDTAAPSPFQLVSGRHRADKAKRNHEFPHTHRKKFKLAVKKSQS